MTKKRKKVAARKKVETFYSKQIWTSCSLQHKRATKTDPGEAQTKKNGRANRRRRRGLVVAVVRTSEYMAAPAATTSTWTRRDATKENTKREKNRHTLCFDWRIIIEPPPCPQCTIFLE
jgi:hypothetical protein